MKRHSVFLIGGLLAAASISPLTAQGQQTGSVRGRVTEDPSRQPLPGVTVTIGSRVTQSRPDGEYIIHGVPVGTDTVRFRLIGYGAAARKVTITAGQDAAVDVSLSHEAVNLSAVVVTGYGEQRAGNITGAVTPVSVENFNTGPRRQSRSCSSRARSPACRSWTTTSRAADSRFASVAHRPSTRAAIRSYVLDGVPIGTGSGGGLSAGRNPLNFLNPERHREHHRPDATPRPPRSTAPTPRTASCSSRPSRARAEGRSSSIP